METPVQIPDEFCSELLRELRAPDCDSCRIAGTQLFSNGLATATIISAVLLRQGSNLDSRKVQKQIARAAQEDRIGIWAVRTGLKCSMAEVLVPARSLLDESVSIFPDQDRFENETKEANAPAILFDTGTARASVQTKPINSVAVFSLKECTEIVLRSSLENQKPFSNPRPPSPSRKKSSAGRPERSDKHLIVLKAMAKFLNEPPRNSSPTKIAEWIVEFTQIERNGFTPIGRDLSHKLAKAVEQALDESRL